MTGAGILALGHAGFHNSVEAKRAAEDLLGYNFGVYNGNGGFKRDRYHYSLFMCCQGMYQMGSPYWEQFFPRTVRIVLSNQRPDGSWDAESWQRDRRYGNSYTTALVILALARQINCCRSFSDDTNDEIQMLSERMDRRGLDCSPIRACAIARPGWKRVTGQTDKRRLATGSRQIQ